MNSDSISEQRKVLWQNHVTSSKYLCLINRSRQVLPKELHVFFRSLHTCADKHSYGVHGLIIDYLLRRGYVLKRVHVLGSWLPSKINQVEDGHSPGIDPTDFWSGSGLKRLIQEITLTFFAIVTTTTSLWISQWIMHVSGWKKAAIYVEVL